MKTKKKRYSGVDYVKIPQTLYLEFRAGEHRSRCLVIIYTKLKVRKVGSLAWASHDPTIYVSSKELFLSQSSDGFDSVSLDFSVQSN